MYAKLGFYVNIVFLNDFISDDNLLRAAKECGVCDRIQKGSGWEGEVASRTRAKLQFKCYRLEIDNG